MTKVCKSGGEFIRELLHPNSEFFTPPPLHLDPHDDLVALCDRFFNIADAHEKDVSSHAILMMWVGLTVRLAERGWTEEQLRNAATIWSGYRRYPHT
jgi:hypothetical protein